MFSKRAVHKSFLNLLLGCARLSVILRYRLICVQGNLLIRIGDALRFEPVSATFYHGALSFQRGYFPIFQFFSSDLVLKSTLHKNIKYVVSTTPKAILKIVQSPVCRGQE